MTLPGYVDPRPVRPPTMGLIPSANNVIDGNDYEQPKLGGIVRWIEGFAYRPGACNAGDIIDPEGAVEGTPPALETAITVHPYIVEGVDQRSTFGATQEGDYAEARDYARASLLACEGKQIEKELWTGTLSVASGWGNRYLADGNASIIEGDRVLGWITALAQLERAIKENTCNQQGMIHARADTISIWDNSGALRRVGNLILTVHDTIVVPGAGYDGSAPLFKAGEKLDPNHSRLVPSTDSAWAYATTVVDVRRGEFTLTQPLPERVNKSTNDLTTYERRVAAATWGCLQVAVHVDHSTASGFTITGS